MGGQTILRDYVRALSGILLSSIISLAVFSMKSELDQKSSSAIYAKLREIQLALGQFNGSCGDSFYGKFFSPNSSEITNIDMIKQRTYGTNNYTNLLSKSSQFDKNYSVKELSIVDKKMVSSDFYTASLKIKLSKLNDNFFGVQDIGLKIPMSLFVSSNGGQITIQDCTTAPETDFSKQMALCLVSTRAGISGYWDSLVQKCFFNPPLNGACGASKNAPNITSIADLTNLCNSGTASSVSEASPGKGPWSWTCNGQYGGMNDACQAQPQSALCGTSDGQLVYSSPTSNFCGVFSTLSGGLAGSGPWNWTCVSTIGGAVIGCGTIGGPVDGKCGSANNLPWDQSKNNLCSQGDNVNFSGGGPWTWNCTGYLGGGTDSCSKTPAAVNGACGSAHNNAVYSSPPPGGDLCASGNVANFSGTGPWYWDCVGPFGGSTDSCFAKYQFCDTRVEPQFGFNSSIMKWQDRPLQDTGAWAYCVDGATLTQCSSCMGPIYNPNAPFQFYLSTSPYYGPWGQLSSTQCSIPHCGIQNGVLKNGTTVTCCKVLP